MNSNWLLMDSHRMLDGLSPGPRWALSLSLDAQWTLTGCLMDSHWMLDGLSLDARWTLTRCSMDSHWILDGLRGFRGRVVGMGTLDQWVRGSNSDARLISKGCVNPLK